MELLLSRISCCISEFLDDRDPFYGCSRSTRCLGHYSRYLVCSSLDCSTYCLCERCSVAVFITVTKHEHLDEGWIRFTGDVLDDEITDIAPKGPESSYFWHVPTDSILCLACGAEMETRLSVVKTTLANLRYCDEDSDEYEYVRDLSRMDAR